MEERIISSPYSGSPLPTLTSIRTAVSKHSNIRIIIIAVRPSVVVIDGVSQRGVEIEISAENVVLAEPVISVRIQIEGIHHSQPLVIYFLVALTTCRANSLQNRQRRCPEHCIECNLADIHSGWLHIQYQFPFCANWDVVTKSILIQLVGILLHAYRLERKSND